MYSKKTLKYVFSSLSGPFDGNGNDKISIGNVKSTFKMDAYGNVGGVQAETVIYGLGIDNLAILSSKGVGVFLTSNQRISIEVYAGEEKIYTGIIFASYANMNAQPESALIINSTTDQSLRMQPASPFSRPGAVAVSDVLSAICRANNFGFRPNGLNGIIHQNPYFDGSPLDQIKQVCLAHDLWYRVFENVVTVWPSSGISDDIVPIVSPEHGLIGYPIFSEYGITFQTQFSTLLSKGRQIDLQTSLPNASGRYNLIGVQHFLSSWMDGGSWHTICQAYRVQNGKQQPTSVPANQ